jgi:hypothetical protein
LDELSTKHEQNKLCKLKLLLYNIYSLHFSAGHVLLTTNPSEKRSEVSIKSKVRGIQGITQIMPESERLILFPSFCFGN